MTQSAGEISVAIIVVGMALASPMTFVEQLLDRIGRVAWLVLFGLLLVCFMRPLFAGMLPLLGAGLKLLLKCAAGAAIFLVALRTIVQFVLRPLD